MSKFDEAKKKFNDMDDDDKIAALGALVLGLFVLTLLGILVAVLIQELLVPALVAVAVYSAGVKWMGWPVPKFVKKLFK